MPNDITGPANRVSAARERMTCRMCYETKGLNVPLLDLPISFDNRSVEAIVQFKCSDEACGHHVRIKL